MKRTIHTDVNGNALPLVIPDKEEFDRVVSELGFTSLEELLEGYSIIDQARRRVLKELSDPESLVTDALGSAMDEIERDIYGLFVCVFKILAENKGEMTDGQAN